MDKNEIAAKLDEMGTLLELKGENPFRTRAYHNAAQALSTSTADLNVLVANGTLTDIKGIGKGLAGLITEFHSTGTAKDYEDLRASIPPGWLQMLRIQGLGPKRIRIITEKLRIDTVDELKDACLSGAVARLEGFGEKTQQNILAGIAHLSSVASKFLISTALEIAAELSHSIGALPQVKRCAVAGSVRRRKELVGDIDIIASVPSGKRAGVFAHFGAHPLVLKLESQGETKSSARLKNGMQCDLRLVEDVEFPFALNYFTGSKEHNVEMRSRALLRGWSLNEYAFTPAEGKKGKKPPRCTDERTIYKALGLTYIPPEVRENGGEFEAASEKELPELVTDADIRGTFHCHTNASDGLSTLEQMAEAAQALGWSYLGIADHSQAASYANGLTSDRVRAQWKAIDRLNARAKGFVVFKGTECDILPDGSLDFPDGLLSGFDYVVASIHSKFKMTEAEATKRVIRALQHKQVTMLGHPTGRLLLEREGYPLDLAQVIQAAADHGKSIEINAHPMRLDLDWRWVRSAKEKGVKICINPDAHHTDGLRDTFYGVGIARKGWLEPADVVNTYTKANVDRFFRRVREG